MSAAIASVVALALFIGVGVVRGLDRLHESGGIVSPAAVEMLPPEPAPDPSRPLAAVLVSNAGTEVTDLVAPYAILQASGAFQVVTVAPVREASPMTGGVDLMPDFSFARFRETFAAGPDLIVVPFFLDREDPALVGWLRRNAQPGRKVLSICEGARTVAAAGLLDGHRATTHFFALPELADAYPGTDWVPGARYVEHGEITSSAGVTAAIDATLAVVRELAGPVVAERTARRLGYRLLEPEERGAGGFSASDYAVLLLRAGWGLPTKDVGVALYPGVDELALAALADAWPRSFLARTHALSAAPEPVQTKRGLWLLARATTASARPFDRLLIPGPQGTAAAPLLAWAAERGLPVEPLPEQELEHLFDAVLSQIANESGSATARLAAHMMEHDFTPDGGRIGR